MLTSSSRTGEVVLALVADDASAGQRERARVVELRRWAAWRRLATRERGAEPKHRRRQVGAPWTEGHNQPFKSGLRPPIGYYYYYRAGTKLRGWKEASEPCDVEGQAMWSTGVFGWKRKLIEQRFHLEFKGGGFGMKEDHLLVDGKPFHRLPV